MYVYIFINSAMKILIFKVASIEVYFENQTKSLTKPQCSNQPTAIPQGFDDNVFYRTDQ